MPLLSKVGDYKLTPVAGLTQLLLQLLQPPGLSLGQHRHSTVGSSQCSLGGPGPRPDSNCCPTIFRPLPSFCASCSCPCLSAGCSPYLCWLRLLPLPTCCLPSLCWLPLSVPCRLTPLCWLPLSLLICRCLPHLLLVQTRAGLAPEAHRRRLPGRRYHEPAASGIPPKGCRTKGCRPKGCPNQRLPNQGCQTKLWP